MRRFLQIAAVGLAVAVWAGGCPSQDPGGNDNGSQGSKGDAGVPGGQGNAGAPGSQGPQGVPGVNCWDLNGNHVNDPDEDTNGDGVFDARDCLTPPDSDFDGVDDDIDNCPTTPNRTQADSDGDGVGDACDVCPGVDDRLDRNGDGVPDCMVTARLLIAQDPPNVLIPNAFTFSTTKPTFNQTDGAGYIWDLDADASVLDGSVVGGFFDDAFDSGNVLSIGTSSFPDQTTIGLEDGREAVFGPATVNGLTVTRKVFVSANGGFARWLDILENSTTSPVSRDVTHVTNYGSDESNPFVTHSADGDGTLSAADLWWVNTQELDSDPGVGIFDISETATKSSDDVTNVRHVDLAPGERTIVISYAAMRSPFGFDPADQLAAVLEQLETFPIVPAEFLSGMTAAELNLVRTRGGNIAIEGHAGSAEPGIEVLVTNNTTQLTRSGVVGPDGAWAVGIPGQSGDNFTFRAGALTGNVTAQ